MHTDLCEQKPSMSTVAVIGRSSAGLPLAGGFGEPRRSIRFDAVPHEVDTCLAGWRSVDVWGRFSAGPTIERGAFGDVRVAFDHAVMARAGLASAAAAAAARAYATV